MGLAPHIALVEAGVEFRAAEQRTPAYHAINPKGRVPALETEHGILTETSAILGYIAARHPEAGLMPEDAFARAKVGEMHLFLAATVHVAHAHRARGSRWADDSGAIEAMKAKMPEVMTDCADLIERHYLGDPWVLGDRFSSADIYLFTVARWFEGDGVGMAGFPKISGFLSRMKARPAVKEALALHM